MVMDITKVSEPPMVHTELPEELLATAVPPSDILIAPLDLEESPKIRTKLRLYIILTALYLALFLSALDTTIIAQSIPTICTDLCSAAGYVWIGSAYLLANAATGPIWAKFSDIWGRKLVLLTAVSLFVAASILAALSINMPLLIAGRALQGVASGGLVQLSIIIISDLFSVRKRSLYLGFSGFVWALAGSAGPLIGGAFTQSVTWRWCFWINVPICGITFGLLLLFLDVNNPLTKLGEGLRVVDWFGILSILAITTLLLVGLDFGGTIFPWNSPKVICLIVFGMLIIGFFLLNEKRLAKYPLMPLVVFKSWSNDAVFLVVFSHGMVLIGIEYYMPLYLQSVQQASPLRSGVLLLPLIVVQAVGEIIAGFLIHRTGCYREFIWAGSLLMMIGTGLYIFFGAETSVAVVVGLEIVGALGPALLFQAPTVAIQNTVSQGDTAAATASLLFLRSIAMSLSIVVGGVVFQNSMDARQSSLAAAGLSASVLEALSGSQAVANVGITQSIQDASQRQLVLEAFAWSMRNMFILYTCLAAIAVVASMFIKHRKLNTEHTETTTGIQHLAKVKIAKE
ncbi:MFS multidrug transporter-like protein [Pseudomassariella vexata]|uniref:MFS multidrug transporter-like protein n=1 Tax=Pseudomassariella vexata TaxID=1141098 RepID=A0A1Y2E1N7_9PEZI|nr:MFS multidrug transporter-like protein [Pseudomassariella vexata]ORY65442.1 MFS multidrug transporter-like protein [Pseudomassariella vexata]